MFSIAHTLVEFTFVMLLACGLLTVANEPIVKLTAGVAGGIILLAFGAFTGLNPFFVVWWLTVGANLILLSLEFASLVVVVFMYLCHVWMDYAWLASVAYFSRMGTNVIGFKGYRLIMAVFGAVLIYFGLTFLINSLSF